MDTEIDKNTSEEELAFKNDKFIADDKNTNLIVKSKKSKFYKNPNFINANCFSRLFFLWSKVVMKISNKRVLKISDVNGLSTEQSIHHNAIPFEKAWNKYSTNKKLKYPLVFAILRTHYKFLIALILLDLLNMLFDYGKMYFHTKIIFLFSKGVFFPKRENNKNISMKDLIMNFEPNIIECVCGFIFIKLIKSIIFHHLEFNNVIIREKITNEISSLIFQKILKEHTTNHQDNKE